MRKKIFVSPKLKNLTIICLFIGSLLLGINGVFRYTICYEIEVQSIIIDNEGIGISGLIFTPLKESKGTIIVIHGYGGRKEALISLSYALVRQDFFVLSIDLRGHGDSKGTFDLGLSESRDVSKAIDFLKSKDLYSDGSFLALFGISFGGVVSIIAGATDPRVSTVITVSTIGNMTRWLKEEVDVHALNRISYLEVTPESLTALDLRSPIYYAANVSSLLIIHGKIDDLVPVQHAYDLASAAPHAKLEILENADHAVPAPFVINTSLSWLNATPGSEELSYLYLIDILSNFTLVGGWFGMFFLLGGLFLFSGSYFSSKRAKTEKISSGFLQKEFLVSSIIVLLSGFYIITTFLTEIFQSPPDLLNSVIISRQILIFPVLIVLSYDFYSQDKCRLVDSPKDFFIRISREDILEFCTYIGIFLGAWILFGVLHRIIFLPFSELLSLVDSPILLIIFWGALIDELWFRWMIQQKIFPQIQSVELKVGLCTVLFVITKTSFAFLIMLYWGLPIAQWLPAIITLFIFLGLSTGIIYEYTNGLRTSSFFATTILTLMYATMHSTLFM